jgi:DNA-binding transcriptional MocR family regulator
VEAAVRAGKLRPGDRLPAVRSLAADLSVSPATVAAAYAELRRRGLVTGTGRAGTTVRPSPPVSTRGYLRAPAGTRDLISGAPDPALLPVLPPRPAARSELYTMEPVVPRLRALAAERFAADGVDPANLAATGGALDGIERVLSAWLMPGDRVAVEDPGHAVTFDLIAAMGLTAVPVPVDEHGMRPDELARALERGAVAVIVTPRAQAATGAAWDEERAARLRDVLAAFPAAGLIEDDHAGPLAGVPGWTASGGPGRWATLRSASKSLGPDLRVAVLAGDEATVARVAGRQALGTGWVSHLLQETVADLWEDPAPVLAAARVYAERGAALRSALAAHAITPTGRSGFTCWVPVPDEDRIASALASSGWAVAPGRRFRIASAPGVRLCFATLTPDEAPRFAADFARAVADRSGRLDLGHRCITAALLWAPVIHRCPLARPTGVPFVMHCADDGRAPMWPLPGKARRPRGPRL